MLKRTTAAGDEQGQQYAMISSSERQADISDPGTYEPDNQQPVFSQSLGQNAGRYFQQPHQTAVDRTNDANLRIAEAKALGKNRQEHVDRGRQSILGTVYTSTGDQDSLSVRPHRKG